MPPRTKIVKSAKKSSKGALRASRNSKAHRFRRHPNYSIPWDLLSEDDAEFFDRAKIECGPSWIRFHRALGRRELATTCARLWNFRSLIARPKANHINFASGDALNEFSRRFGKRDSEFFIKEFVRVGNLRDEVLKITGGVLIYLQTVEHLIKGCCAMLKLKGLHLTLEDFQSKDPKRRHHTLGELKKALLNTVAFTDGFQIRLNDFVAGRNEFVHSFWTDEVKIDERTGLPSEVYYQDKLQFTVSLMKNANEIERIFRGLLGIIGESLSKTQRDRKMVFPWKKYIGAFSEVLQKK
jgi:hypothetical protein